MRSRAEHPSLRNDAVEHGRSLGALIKAPLRSYGPPRVSPDGTRLAIGILDQGDTEIWIWDLARETLRRLTFSPGMDGLPVWTPDSRRIIFMSDRTGVLNLYSQPADGTGTIDRLTTSANPQWPTSITPDGAWLSGFDLSPSKADTEIVFFPLARPVIRRGSGSARGVSQSPVEPFAKTRFTGKIADFSPNGRYFAYESNESGLMIKNSADDPNATPASMVVVEHWFEELKQRVPTN